MSRYSVELRPAAVKALRRIDPRDRPRIQGAIALLGETIGILLRASAGAVPSLGRVN